MRFLGGKRRKINRGESNANRISCFALRASLRPFGYARGQSGCAVGAALFGAITTRAGSRKPCRRHNWCSLFRGDQCANWHLAFHVPCHFWGEFLHFHDYRHRFIRFYREPVLHDRDCGSIVGRWGELHVPWLTVAAATEGLASLLPNSIAGASTK